MTFTVSAPLIPLLPEGHHYPDGYSLPKRKRNKDALDIPTLVSTFRESLIYDEISTIPIETKSNTSKNNRQIQESTNNINVIHSNIAVLSVLSPYSLLPHVMIMELSEKRYLPGPESFNETEWIKVSNLAKRVIISMKKTNDSLHQTDTKFKYTSQCCGFNWSPFAWGEIEEKMSCQSVTTKFHMMIWQWSFSDLTESFIQKKDIPEVKKNFFYKNEYNNLFGQLVLKELGIEFNNSVCCGPRGVFIPFDVLNANEENGIENNIKKMREIAIVVEKIIMHINQCLTYDSTEELRLILQKTSQRNLNKDELKILRKNPLLRPLNEALLLCNSDQEYQIIKLIYPAAQNRACFTSMNECSYVPEEIWMKGFGFSMVLCQSKVENVIKSGLYICLKAMCGSGGVAETLGCYLRRPENSLAHDEVMIKFNHSIWTIKKYLEGKLV